MGRPTWYDVKGNKKGEWTAEEDRKLVAYINEHGLGDWRLLPKRAGLERCGKSCRLRWLNYLRPGIKRGKFTPKEEEDIIKFHGVLGNRWAAIARQMPNRTDNDIKNHWNSCLRKRLTKNGIDPMTHKRMIHDPMIYEQMIHEPATTHEPIIHEPVKTHEPMVHEPVSHEPIIHEPVTTHEPSMVQEPVTHESMVQEPVRHDESMVQEPMRHEPILTVEASSSSTMASSTQSPTPSHTSPFSASISGSASLLNKLASRKHDLNRLIKNVILSTGPSSGNNNVHDEATKMIRSNNEEEEAMLMDCFMEIIDENLISTTSFDDLPWESLAETTGFEGFNDPYGLSQSDLYESGPLDVFLF